MLIILEGIVMCFILLMVCVIGIQNGPVGSVYFYEPDVQERVVQLGLTTKKKIKRDCLIASVAPLRCHTMAGTTVKAITKLATRE